MHSRNWDMAGDGKTDRQSHTRTQTRHTHAHTQTLVVYVKNKRLDGVEVCQKVGKALLSLRARRETDATKYKPQSWHHNWRSKQTKHWWTYVKHEGKWYRKVKPAVKFLKQSLNRWDCMASFTRGEKRCSSFLARDSGSRCSSLNQTNFICGTYFPRLQMTLKSRPSSSLGQFQMLYCALCLASSSSTLFNTATGRQFVMQGSKLRKIMVCQ